MKMNMETGGWELTREEAVNETREPLRYEFQGDEKSFESHVMEHLPDIIAGMGLPPIRVADRQVQVKSDDFMIRMDIVVRHADDSITVFELKCRNGKNPHTSPFNQMTAIGQMLLYKSVVKAKTGISPRLVLVDNKIHYRTLLAFNEMKLPIILLELQMDRVFIPYRYDESGGGGETCH